MSFFYCSAVSEQILLHCHCKIILLYLISLESALLSFSSMADADSIVFKNIVLKIKFIMCTVVHKGILFMISLILKRSMPITIRILHAE